MWPAIHGQHESSYNWTGSFYISYNCELCNGSKVLNSIISFASPRHDHKHYIIKHKCRHKIQKPFFTFNYEEWRIRVALLHKFNIQHKNFCLLLLNNYCYYFWSFESLKVWWLIHNLTKLKYFNFDFNLNNSLFVSKGLFAIFFVMNTKYSVHWQLCCYLQQKDTVVEANSSCKIAMKFHLLFINFSSFILFQQILYGTWSLQANGFIVVVRSTTYRNACDLQTFK